METQAPKETRLKDTMKRSIVKSVSYRILIITMDFITVYLFTGKVNVAIGFMLVSNTYTTITYFFHERIWDKIKWGKATVVN
jgi:adenylylsulfate kinase